MQTLLRLTNVNLHQPCSTASTLWRKFCVCDAQLDVERANSTPEDLLTLSLKKQVWVKNSSAMLGQSNALWSLCCCYSSPYQQTLCRGLISHHWMWNAGLEFATLWVYFNTLRPSPNWVFFFFLKNTKFESQRWVLGSILVFPEAKSMLLGLYRVALRLVFALIHFVCLCNENRTIYFIQFAYHDDNACDVLRVVMLFSKRTAQLANWPNEEWINFTMTVTLRSIY